MLNYLIQFLSIFITILTWAILIRVLLSWIPNLSRDNPLVQLLMQITDPVLEPGRRLIPPMGGMDFSPIVVILVLQFLGRMLMSLQ